MKVDIKEMLHFWIAKKLKEKSTLSETLAVFWSQPGCSPAASSNGSQALISSLKPEEGWSQFPWWQCLWFSADLPSHIQIWPLLGSSQESGLPRSWWNTGQRKIGKVSWKVIWEFLWLEMVFSPSCLNTRKIKKSFSKMAHISLEAEEYIWIDGPWISILPRTFPLWSRFEWSTLGSPCPAGELP